MTGRHLRAPRPPPDGRRAVFAPTNETFEDLYDVLSIDEITELPPELVLEVLRYHVVEGRRAANRVVPPREDRSITTSRTPCYCHSTIE